MINDILLEVKVIQALKHWSILLSPITTHHYAADAPTSSQFVVHHSVTRLVLPSQCGQLDDTTLCTNNWQLVQLLVVDVNEAGIEGCHGKHSIRGQIFWV
jgi:hypothetical protein